MNIIDIEVTEKDVPTLDDAFANVVVVKDVTTFPSLINIKESLISEFGSRIPTEAKTKEERDTVKKVQEEVNKLFGEMDSRRIAKKKEIMEEWNVFEKEYKKEVVPTINLLKESAAKVISDFDNKLLTEFETEMQEYWEELCVAKNTHVRTFDSLGLVINLTAMNQKTKTKKLLDDTMSSLVSDLNAIKMMGDKGERVRAYYEKDFNLNLAMERVQEEDAIANRLLEQERARMQEEERKRIRAEEEERIRQEERERIASLQKEVVPQEETVQAPTFFDTQVPLQPAPSQVLTYTLTVTGTETALESLIEEIQDRKIGADILFAKVTKGDVL